VTYEEAIEEGEGSEWEEECDEPSGTVKSDEKFPRTKPIVVPQHSLLTKLIHGNDEGSASCSSPESRRPRTPNNFRASSPSSTRQKMVSKEIFSGSDVDLIYDPTDSTVNEIENLSYNVTKTPCE